MATIKYLLQSNNPNAPVYLRLSLGRGKGLKRKTGYICNPQDWSSATSFPKMNNAHNKQMQSNLKKLESFVIEQFNTDNSKGVLIDGDWLSRIIDLFHGRKEPESLEYLVEYGEHFIKRLPYRVSQGGKMGVNKDTITKYTTIVSKLKDFQIYKKKKYLVKDVDLNFRSEFLEYLTQVDKINHNTAGRYISFVKTIIRDARKSGIEVSVQIDDFTGFTIKPPIVTFSFDEIKSIRDKEFKKDVHNITRDWFVIGCYLGQRASDLFRMNTKMIERIGGYDFVVLTQEKTGKLVQIPVHEEVQKVLDARKGKFPPKLAENMDSCTTLFNRYIKEVCEIAEINDVVTGNLLDHETNRYKTGKHPKWKLASSHSCRRSFATNFYAQREYPTPLLMNITGHGTEEMFLNYIGKEPIDYSIQLAEIWRKKAQEREKVENDKEPIKLTVLKTANI